MTAVTDASCSEATLETSWEAAEGKIDVTTDRNPGETDEEFVARHEIAVLEVMLTSPPQL